MILINNSVYGKTTENFKKIINIKLVNNAKDYKKYASKLSFFSRKIFSKYFVAIHEIKLVLLPNIPMFVGLSILDLSKYLMYNFHYF